MPEAADHNVEVVPAKHYYQGFVAHCHTCGWQGPFRWNKFDAGEDAIAHQDTGEGARSAEEVLKGDLEVPGGEDGGE